MLSEPWVKGKLFSLHSSTSQLLSTLSTSYDLLLLCLHHFEVKDAALRWFALYLSCCQQIVNVKGQHSSSRTLANGVLQWSVLGLILFSLYRASLGKLLHDHGESYQVYADVVCINLHQCTGRRNWRCCDPNQSLLHAYTKTDKCKPPENEQQQQKSCIHYTHHQKTAASCHAACMLVQSVYNVDVIFDVQMCIESHVSAICHQAYLLLRNIAELCSFMTHSMLKWVI